MFEDTSLGTAHQFRIAHHAAGIHVDDEPRSSSRHKKHKGYEGVCLIDTDEKREKALKLFSVEDVWGICRDNAIQGNLFDTVNREKQAALAKAIDAINRKNGHNKIRVAVQGDEKGWQLKREYISKQYTTNLEDVIVLKTY